MNYDGSFTESEHAEHQTLVATFLDRIKSEKQAEIKERSKKPTTDLRWEMIAEIDEHLALLAV